MRKTVKTLLLVLCLSLVMTAVSSCFERKDEVDKIKVVGTVFPQYDFARAVGGERVECEMLMMPGNDSHSYSGDNPSDILRIQKCDLFIYVGGETDGKWVNSVLSLIESNGNAPLSVALTDICDLMEESGSGMLEQSSSHNHEHGTAEYDGHVWTSMKNCIKAVEAIKDALSEIDPDGADYYKANAEEYKAKLQSLDKSFENLFEGTERTLIFADKFPFAYFAHDYRLECYAAFNGCASQSEPSPTTVVKLCEKVGEIGTDYIFYTESSQSKVPDVIEKATGAKPLLLHSCHTVTEKEFESGITFTELWEQNLKTLEEAFNHE